MGIAERDLNRSMPHRFMVHTTSTYWYLEAVPELLQLATDRLIRTGRAAMISAEFPALLQSLFAGRLLRQEPACNSRIS
jgi:hypothetical protein